MLSKKHLLLFTFFLSVFGANYGQVVTVDQKIKNIYIKNQVLYLEDATNKLTLKAILESNNFKKVEKDIPNFGISNSSFWLKLRVKNNIDINNFLLQIGQPGLDEVELYQMNAGKYIVSEGGEKFPFNHREFFDPNYIFRIELAPGKISDIYIKVRARDNIQVPIIIGTQETIAKTNKVKDTLVGIFLGIMLVMMLYNLFLYAIVRDKSYLYYVLYIITVLLTQASIQGYTYQYLWPNWPLIAQYSSFIFPPLVGIASAIFVSVFLQTKTYVPILHKGFSFFIIGYIIAFAFSLFGFFVLSFQLIEVCAGGISFYLALVGVKVLRKGYRPASFFLIAWAIFLAGVSLYVMKDLGVLPYNNYTNYMMPLGSAIEVVLLSFALADRINRLEKEKKQHQADALAALEKNKKLITEQNVMLEQKVHERTEELEVKNNQLEGAFLDLKETQSQLVSVEKMASLGQLTAGIAHEINNPINFVSANIRPLQLDISDLLNVLNRYEDITNEENLSEKLAGINSLKKEIDLDYIKKEINSLLSGIEDGAKRTAEIVTGLKDFAHLDSNDVKLADINQGIESTLVLLKSVMGQNIEVVKNLGEIPKIECYPGKLNQVFMNILNNAIQAMNKNQTRKNHVLTITSLAKNDNVIVSIEDTGYGMTPEVKAKIFEPFFTTKPVGEGTGLGMSIVFGIIESHHAKIDIESEPGQGSKITLTLQMRLQNVSLV